MSVRVLASLLRMTWEGSGGVPKPLGHFTHKRQEEAPGSYLQPAPALAIGASGARTGG